MFRMNSNSPGQKVTAAALGAAIVQVLIWFVEVESDPIKIPAGVSAAITTIVVFAVGYLIPPGKKEQVVELSKPNTPLGRQAS
ncbi:hypothetical protein [Pelagibius sp. Alg239-R121]|uniref:hypothetical protein n=1 Tax=Pelagibius sp. Alg239-R121 TaxID=2993448 RepID=UPI0024A72A47|nr:hypothetical protein [Pelagibius sp. Alg239-R121]